MQEEAASVQRREVLRAVRVAHRGAVELPQYLVFLTTIAGVMPPRAKVARRVPRRDGRFIL
jgi:hypothetical protein